MRRRFLAACVATAFGAGCLLAPANLATADESGASATVGQTTPGGQDGVKSVNKKDQSGAVAAKSKKGKGKGHKGKGKGKKGKRK